MVRTTRPPPRPESCDDAIAASLDKALDGLARSPRRRRSTSGKGREHLAAQRHSLFDGIPVLRDPRLGARSPPTARPDLNRAVLSSPAATRSRGARAGVSRGL